MRLSTIVCKEIFERKNQLATSLTAITLGITVIVAIKNITFFSEKAVARRDGFPGCERPRAAQVGDAAELLLGGPQREDDARGVRLTACHVDPAGPGRPVAEAVGLGGPVGATTFTLTGILPKSEFQAKAAWTVGDLLAAGQGCGTIASVPGRRAAPESLVCKRAIEPLKGTKRSSGPISQRTLGVKAGVPNGVLGQAVRVPARLPQTGTVDDSRVFAHLHAVQDLTRQGPVVNAIEVVGCCNEISVGLVPKMNKSFPRRRW